MSGVHEYGTRDQTDAVAMEGFNVFKTEEGMCIRNVLISLTFTGFCTIHSLPWIRQIEIRSRKQVLTQAFGHAAPLCSIHGEGIGNKKGFQGGGF